MAAEREFSILLKSYNQMGPGLSSATRMISSFVSANKKGLIGLGLVAGTTAGVLMALGKRAVDLDNKMLDVKAAGSLTNKEMLGMKESIIASNKVWGVGVDKMAELSKSFVEAGGDARFLTQNMDFAAKVMSASGMAPEVLGSALGELQKDLGGTSEQYKVFISEMFNMSKASGREQTFNKMMPKMGDLLKTYKAANPSGTYEGFRKYMTLAMFSPNPESVTKIQRRLFTLLSKEEKMGKAGPLNALWKMGLTAESAMKMGPLELLRTIKEKSPSAAKALADIFGKAGMDAAGMYNNVDKIMAALASKKQDFFTTAAEENAAKFAASVERIRAAFDEIATKMMPPIEKFMRVVAGIVTDPKALKTGMQAGIIGGGSVLALGGLLAAFGMGKGGGGLPGGKGGLMGMLGGLGTAGNPMHVIVVGGGGIGGMSGGIPGGGKGIMNKVGQVGLVVGTAVSAFEVATQILKATGGYDALIEAGAWLHKKMVAAPPAGAGFPFKPDKNPNSVSTVRLG